jgi:hypothetical protein
MSRLIRCDKCNVEKKEWENWIHVERRTATTYGTGGAFVQWDENKWDFCSPECASAFFVGVAKEGFTQEEGPVPEWAKDTGRA